MTLESLRIWNRCLGFKGFRVFGFRALGFWGLGFLESFGFWLPRAPSIQIEPTLGSKVCKQYLTYFGIFGAPGVYGIGSRESRISGFLKLRAA